MGTTFLLQEAFLIIGGYIYCVADKKNRGKGLGK